jgi:serine/threonine protein kinase
VLGHYNYEQYRIIDEVIRSSDLTIAWAEVGGRRVVLVTAPAVAGAQRLATLRRLTEREELTTDLACPYLASGLDDQRSWLALEAPEGSLSLHDLAEAIDARPDLIVPLVAARIVADAASALRVVRMHAPSLPATGIGDARVGADGRVVLGHLGEVLTSPRLDEAAQTAELGRWLLRLGAGTSAPLQGLAQKAVSGELRFLSDFVDALEHALEDLAAGDLAAGELAESTGQYASGVARPEVGRWVQEIQVARPRIAAPALIGQLPDPIVPGAIVHGIAAPGPLSPVKMPGKPYGGGLQSEDTPPTTPGYKLPKPNFPPATPSARTPRATTPVPASRRPQSSPQAAPNHAPHSHAPHSHAPHSHAPHSHATPTPAPSLEAGLPSATPAMGTGLVAGKYRIVGRIADGRMGRVYEALRLTDQQRVALKLMQPAEEDPAMAAEYEARFRREAQSLAKLSHPNIVGVYEFGFDGDCWLAMEYVRGSTLAKLLRARGHLPVADVLRIARQLASALAHAHGQGVIHRDLKPANVILANDDPGDVRLVDFGLAKHWDGSADLTNEGTLLGTPHYMAPEQCQGEPGRVESDLYALGMMMYRLLSGRMPFEGKRGAGILLAHTSAPVPSFRSLDLPFEIPRQVELVVRRCLEKQPQSRFRTALDLDAALEACQRGTPVPMPRQPVPPAKPWSKRKILASVAAVAVLAFGLVGGATSATVLWMMSRAEPRVSQPVEPVERAAPAPRAVPAPVLAMPSASGPSGPAPSTEPEEPAPAPQPQATEPSPARPRERPMPVAPAPAAPAVPAQGPAGPAAPAPASGPTSGSPAMPKTPMPTRKLKVE